MGKEWFFWGFYLHWMQFFMRSLIGPEIRWTVPSPLIGQHPRSHPSLPSPPNTRTLWTLFVDTFYGHMFGPFWGTILWTLSEDNFFKHILGIFFVDTSFGHFLGGLFVDTFCGHFWTLFVDTLCGHFLWTHFENIFWYNKLFSWNNG